MSKQTKSGNGNMLLLAGLGVGAFMLFANKSGAQGNSSSADMSNSGEEPNDIPPAPKILAVNQNSTESPTPTGIVSDEDGMEATGTSASTQDDDNDQSDEEYPKSSGSIVSKTRSTGRSVTNKRQAQSEDIPPLISTTLTAKEKSIISNGALSDNLAIQRPDLYKAIYIRKHGRNAKALQAADNAIQSIQMKGNSAATATQKKSRKLAITLNPNSQRMIMAAAQATGGGMAAMAALTTVNATRYAANGNAPVKTKPVQRKGGSNVAQHPAARRPVAKHPPVKHRAGSPVRKAAPHKKH